MIFFLKKSQNLYNIILYNTNTDLHIRKYEIHENSSLKVTKFVVLKNLFLAKITYLNITYNLCHYYFISHS